MNFAVRHRHIRVIVTVALGQAVPNICLPEHSRMRRRTCVSVAVRARHASAWSPQPYRETSWSSYSGQEGSQRASRLHPALPRRGPPPLLFSHVPRSTQHLDPAGPSRSVFNGCGSRSTIWLALKPPLRDGPTPCEAMLRRQR